MSNNLTSTTDGSNTPPVSGVDLNSLGSSIRELTQKVGEIDALKAKVGELEASYAKLEATVGDSNVAIAALTTCADNLKNGKERPSGSAL